MPVRVRVLLPCVLLQHRPHLPLRAAAHDDRSNGTANSTPVVICVRIGVLLAHCRVRTASGLSCSKRVCARHFAPNPRNPPRRPPCLSVHALTKVPLRVCTCARLCGRAGHVIGLVQRSLAVIYQGTYFMICIYVGVILVRAYKVSLVARPAALPRGSQAHVRAREVRKWSPVGRALPFGAAFLTPSPAGSCCSSQAAVFGGGGGSSPFG